MSVNKQVNRYLKKEKCFIRKVGNHLESFYNFLWLKFRLNYLDALKYHFKMTIWMEDDLFIKYSIIESHLQPPSILLVYTFMRYRLSLLIGRWTVCPWFLSFNISQSAASVTFPENWWIKDNGWRNEEGYSSIIWILNIVISRKNKKWLVNDDKINVWSDMNILT